MIVKIQNIVWELDEETLQESGNDYEKAVKENWLPNYTTLALDGEYKDTDECKQEVNDRCEEFLSETYEFPVKSFKVFPINMND